MHMSLGTRFWHHELENTCLLLSVLFASMQLLEKELKLVPGFHDTPFILYLLKTELRYQKTLQYIDTVGLNRHWLEVSPAKHAQLPIHFCNRLQCVC